MEMRLIRRDAAWLSRVDPSAVAVEKTSLRQSPALANMTEKSSLALVVLERTVLVGALCFRTVEALVVGFVSPAALLGDCNDGREMVDSGRTQYTAWEAKLRIASAR